MWEWKGFGTEAFYLKEESLPTTLQFPLGPAFLTGVGDPLHYSPLPLSGGQLAGLLGLSCDPTAVKGERLQWRASRRIG